MISSSALFLLLLPLLFPDHPDLPVEPLHRQLVELDLPAQGPPQPGLGGRRQRDLAGAAHVLGDCGGREEEGGGGEKINEIGDTWPFPDFELKVELLQH